MGVKETEKVGQPEGQAGRVVREREGGTCDLRTKGLDPGGTRLSTVITTDERGEKPGAKVIWGPRGAIPKWESYLATSAVQAPGSSPQMGNSSQNSLAFQ